MSHWTIHGLWPSRVNGFNYPCECTDEEFDASTIQALSSTMKFLWPSLKNTDNEAFWKHEYEKHGTCTVKILKSQLMYFSTTLNMRGANDPKITLGNDFAPSQERGYAFKDIHDRLSAVPGGSIALHCREAGSPNQALSEIVFCYHVRSSTEYDFFPCPETVVDGASSRCHENMPVWILPTK